MTFDYLFDFYDFFDINNWSNSNNWKEINHIYICHEISMLKILTQDVRTFMTFITIIILKEEKIGQSGYIGISWK